MSKWQEINEGLTPRNIGRMAGEPWVRWVALPGILLAILAYGVYARWERESARPPLPDGPYPVRNLPLDVDWIRVTGSRTDDEARRLVPGGGQYHGGLKQNLPHGQGSFTWPDGSRYRGDFVDGQPEGQGRYQWPDGSYFHGSFAAGQPEGVGQCLLPSGMTACRYRPGHLERVTSHE